MKKIFYNDLGNKEWIDEKWLTDLRFADDAALTTISINDMDAQNGLEKASMKIWLKK